MAVCSRPADLLEAEAAAVSVVVTEVSVASVVSVQSACSPEPVLVAWAEPAAWVEIASSVLAEFVLRRLAPGLVELTAGTASECLCMFRSLAEHESTHLVCVCHFRRCNQLSEQSINFHYSLLGSDSKTAHSKKISKAFVNV